MMKRHFEAIWGQLRAKKPQLVDYLEEVRISNFRGIKDLRVPFVFPVSVIAGPNACGKSTVLFSCACAYKFPDKKAIFPANIFPNFKPRGESLPGDSLANASFEYSYIAGSQRLTMRWSRGKEKWNKSFGGRKGAKQPVRHLYMRTLANLMNPSEVRSFLQIGTGDFTSAEITSDLIAFALRILPLKYKAVHLVSKKTTGRDLLFVTRDEDSAPHYSEFHMSAGERAILRISKDISRLQNALILIDEIEAGLHPYSQQQLMLELQRLALRNNLQIIVTSHSPVILDCVPPEGRIFLSRTSDNVVRELPYRDILQKAFFGQSLDKLSVLCEDSVAEAIVLGIIDVLAPQIGVSPNDIVIGRDTGKDKFEQHIEAIGKFGMLDSFLFVLDGDARNLEQGLKATAKEHGSSIEPLFLPGSEAPEKWLWEVLNNSEEYAPALGLSSDDMRKILTSIDNLFASATDKPSEIAKNKLEEFSRWTKRSVCEIARMVSSGELKKGLGDIKILADTMNRLIEQWRNR